MESAAEAAWAWARAQERKAGRRSPVASSCAPRAARTSGRRARGAECSGGARDGGAGGGGAGGALGLRPPRAGGASPGAGIDVFAAEPEPIAAPLLQSLVRATGGLVVPQQSFAPDEFGENLRKSLLEQSVPRCGAPRCTLEVSASPNIEITHLIGPAVLTDDDDNDDGSADDSGGSSSSSNYAPPTRLKAEVNRRDGRLAISLFFNVVRSKRSKGADNDCAYFQFVSKYFEASGAYIARRVTSHRIAITDSEEKSWSPSTTTCWRCSWARRPCSAPTPSARVGAARRLPGGARRGVRGAGSAARSRREGPPGSGEEE